MADEKVREVAVALSQNLISSRFGADAKNFYIACKQSKYPLIYYMQNVYYLIACPKVSTGDVVVIG
jgi:hypothetical protein